MCVLTSEREQHEREMCFVGVAIGLFYRWKYTNEIIEWSNRDGRNRSQIVWLPPACFPWFSRWRPTPFDPANEEQTRVALNSLASRFTILQFYYFWFIHFLFSFSFFMALSENVNVNRNKSICCKKPMIETMLPRNKQNF